MSLVCVARSPISEEHLNISGQHDPWQRDSILIYLSLAGSVLPMRILDSDSIGSVKLRIQTCQGFFELARNNSRVQDYGVADGKVLHLVLRLSHLQAITVQTRKRNVGYMKRQIAKKGKGFLDFTSQELICNGEKLEDQRLIDICKTDDAVMLLVVRKSAKVRAKPVEKDFEVVIVASDLVVPAKPMQKNFLFEPLIVNPKIELPLTVKKLISATFHGLERGNQPVRSSEGSGGAYFMQDSSGEEYVSGLPLSIDGEGLKKGTRVGEGALREVAAYLLDHPRNGPRLFNNEDEEGFAGVPPTVMVKCLHRGFNYPKGSQISVLDIRLANADRHAGNILVSKCAKHNQIKLVPIDHGYCLPENFEDCTFDWLYWPQAQYIELLKFYGWDLSLECARFFRISTMLLKKGIVQEAQAAVLPETSEAEFLESVSMIMDHYLDKHFT
ncbi:1-phosphatidylinositol 4-kinase [Bertholletia excelsa]